MYHQDIIRHKLTHKDKTLTHMTYSYKQLNHYINYTGSNKVYTNLLMFVSNKNIRQLDKFLMDKSLNTFHCIILFSCGIGCMLRKLHKPCSWGCSFYSVGLVCWGMYRLGMWVDICLCTWTCHLYMWGSMLSSGICYSFQGMLNIGIH